MKSTGVPGNQERMSFILSCGNLVHTVEPRVTTNHLVITATLEGQEGGGRTKTHTTFIILP